MVFQLFAFVGGGEPPPILPPIRENPVLLTQNFHFYLLPLKYLPHDPNTTQWGNPHTFKTISKILS